MLKLLKAYMNTNPQGNFKGMSYSDGVLKISFDDRVEIVTMTGNGVSIVKY